MPLNYKYADPGRSEKRGSGSRRKIIAFVLLIFAVVAVVLYGAFFFTTRNSDEHILLGQYQQAIEILDHWRWLPLVNGRVYEETGTAQLLLNGAESARASFSKAETKPFFRPVRQWPEVLNRLWTQGRYADGSFYVNHVGNELGQDGILQFYKAGFLAGQNKLNEAAKELAAAGNVPGLSKEIGDLKSEIDQRLTTGRFALAYDRENLPLINVMINGVQPEIVHESVRPLLQNRNGDYLAELMKNPNRQVMLTVDRRIQTAAHNAIGKYSGAIVVLNPHSGDILAAVGTTRRGVPMAGKKPMEPAAGFVTFYEPGSIIKIITLAGALEKNIDLTKIFPFNCEGNMVLSNNKILYDWKTHAEMKDVNIATAVSCNVAFAKLGLALKPADLLSNLRQFGFDSKLRDTFIPLDLGIVKQGDDSEFYLSNLSIGLEYLQMTPLHAALIASSIANKGIAMRPRILLRKRNIIGIPSPVEKEVEYNRFMSERSASAIAKAMEYVVQFEEGTGRRAALKDMKIAMKTGTAGEGSKGYDAVIIGFAPSTNPRIAFSIVLENAGKAEFEGARVTKLLLESIQGYIK